MSVHPKLAELAGRWVGHYRLHTSWLENKIHECQTSAQIDLRVKDQFLTIEYEWEYEGRQQEGVLILGCDEMSSAVQAIWTDSWHMSHKFMVCDGAIDEKGVVNVNGFYQVSDHPDWGWRTEIFPAKDSFKYAMYNIAPEGKEDIAVEVEYSRQ
jgi:hypothetical protein